MLLFSRLIPKIKQYPLSYRLLLYVILCSSLLALLATTIQLYLDYRRDVNALYKSFGVIKKSYLNNIAASTFKIDTDHLQIELEGALNLPDIVFVEVRELRGDKVQTYPKGDPNATNIIRKEFPLVYESPSGEKRHMGTLVALASLEDVYQRLWSRVFTILATNFIKTFLASASILALIYLLMSRHLIGVAHFTEHLVPGVRNRILTLNRKPRQTDTPDELEHVVKAINDLQERVSEDMIKQREAEEKYRTVAEFTYDWEYWADFDGNLLYMSPSCERISGYTVQEFLDNPSHLKEIVLPDDKEIWDQHYRESREELRPRELQFRIQRRGGEIRWIEHACQPVYDDQGNPTGFRASNRDITERKQFEIALEQSRNFNQSTLDSLQYEIAILDTNGNILGVNESWKRFARENDAGSMDRLATGVNYLDICRRSSDSGDELARAALDGIGSVLEGGRKQFALEYPCHSPSQKRWFLMRVTGFMGHRGGVIISHSNITERKLAENDLRDAYGEIEQLKNQLEAETAYLREEIKLQHNFENIIGNSAAIQYVLFKVEQVSRTESTVLVLGETGTGKELVSRAIHNNSERKQHTLVKVNCATLPANLIESELFGHERGAFTGAQNRQIGRFEVADGTSIFLDEIGELPLELQTKLLRVIQDGEFERLGSSRTIHVNVRVIAATNRDLEKEVRKGLFREDLFYGLNVFPITVPPLRERIEDIPMLAEFFLERASKRMGKNIDRIPASVMNALEHHAWPGNVRELENVIERAVINSSGPKLRLAEDLKPQQIALHTPLKTIEELEREHIIRVLEHCDWKVSGKNGAAEILGLKRGTLRARMNKLGIRKPSGISAKTEDAHNF
jgi:PAS domain S-box-containing protein